MTRHRLQQSALFIAILLLLIAGVGGLWLRSAQRQYTLNRQLIAALVHSDTKQAIALVNAGADPNTRFKGTPVPTLPELVKQLFHRSAPQINDSPTGLAIACGAPWDGDKATYLAQERHSDAPRMVQAMLRHGAKVDTKDEGGRTPLLWAIAGNRLNTEGVLLEHGANVNTKDESGWTPLITAVRSGTALQGVRLLLEHGADISAQEGAGTTALEGAVDCRDKDKVRLLLQYGANLNVQDGAGSTTLISATIRVCVDDFPLDMVRLLLTLGADPNISDEDGKTPLMWTQQYKRPDLAALLRHYGARK